MPRVSRFFQSASQQKMEGRLLAAAFYLHLKVALDFSE
jgi:hypothetical protein